MQNGLGSPFHLKETILDFSTKFAQKESFQSKAGKVSIAIEYCKFELANVLTFILNKRLLVQTFGPNLH